MAVNRWKIPVTAVGGVDSVFKWPWYWRYPIAVGIAAASLGLFIWLENSHSGEYIPVVFGGIGLFISLCIARELLFLLLGGGVLWLGYASISDSNWHMSEERWLSISAAAWGIYLLVKVDEMGKAINQLKNTQSVMEMEIDNLRRRLGV